MKCLFRHKYTPIAASQVYEIYIYNRKFGMPLTMVTLKCQRCGKFKQRKRYGHLTLEDILGGKR